MLQDQTGGQRKREVSVPPQTEREQREEGNVAPSARVCSVQVSRMEPNVMVCRSRSRLIHAECVGSVGEAHMKRCLRTAGSVYPAYDNQEPDGSLPSAVVAKRRSIITFF